MIYLLELTNIRIITSLENSVNYFDPDLYLLTNFILVCDNKMLLYTNFINLTFQIIDKSKLR